MSLKVDPAALVQLEIPVTDLDAAGRFYAAAFGWLSVPALMHDRRILDVGAGCGWGIALVLTAAARQPRSRQVVAYFRADQPQMWRTSVTSAGGEWLFGPKSVPGLGEIAQLADLDGNVFGLFHSGPIGGPRGLAES